jgi:hypothetical protein
MAVSVTGAVVSVTPVDEAAVGSIVVDVGVLDPGVDGLVVIVGTSSASPAPDPQAVRASSVMRTVAVPRERMAPWFQLKWPVARHHTG